MTQNWKRFFALRRRVFDAIDSIVNDPDDDGYHKSYEGAMDVTFCFDNYFNADNDEHAIAGVKIELHCYLLINGRHEEWWGDTFEEALDKAEAGINDILEVHGSDE